ncbi:MAG: hypothetical protein J1E98_11460 [Lachnospiraceae bacterium]|nr:hypothetical protein [Lachnospiraceae bacterium]
MKIKGLIHKIKPPCPKCPYTLGLVYTLTSPCLECKVNGYQMYEVFLGERFGDTEIYSEEGKK